MALQNREVGERVTRLRAERGNPPQEIVATKLGVAHRSYQAWEAGDTKPSWRNLEKLASFYGVSPEYILTGEELAAQPNPHHSGTKLDAIADRLDQIEERQEEILQKLGLIDEHIGALTDQDRDLIARIEAWMNQQGRDMGRGRPQSRGERKSPPAGSQVAG